MAYERQEVIDGVTVFDKALYDNLQDGIEESLSKVGNIESALDSIIKAQEDIIGGSKHE